MWEGYTFKLLYIRLTFKSKVRRKIKKKKKQYSHMFDPLLCGLKFYSAFVRLGAPVSTHGHESCEKREISKTAMETDFYPSFAY